ncbi:unnamed protein product [Lepeophtheirus salmonis]|uniref:(salmon louse) hypothetical protein n=1 Tax=Lepeophtheirus salmonis TaxID=72036 RepID=A0A7R8HAN9_LEPSM|nr:unnamed protein product [Lepeophtheirus salmonis]CAF2978335.1 unnamed protein product [Lepeophtheirus salmonis]
MPLDASGHDASSCVVFEDKLREKKKLELVVLASGDGVLGTTPQGYLPTPTRGSISTDTSRNITLTKLKSSNYYWCKTKIVDRRSKTAHAIINGDRQTSTLSLAKSHQSSQMPQVTVDNMIFDWVINIFHFHQDDHNFHSRQREETLPSPAEDERETRSPEHQETAHQHLQQTPRSLNQAQTLDPSLLMKNADDSDLDLPMHFRCACHSLNLGATVDSMNASNSFSGVYAKNHFCPPINNSLYLIK